MMKYKSEDVDQIKLSKTLVHHQLITEGEFKGAFVLRPKSAEPFSPSEYKQINSELELIKSHGFVSITSTACCGNERI